MKWKKDSVIKSLAFLGALAFFAAAAVMSWYQLVNFDAIWDDSGAGDGYTVRYLERRDFQDIVDLLWLYNSETLGQELSISQEQDKVELEDQFNTDATNLRWQARDTAGNLRYGNTEEEVSVRALGLYQDTCTWTSAVSSVQADIVAENWYTMAVEAVNVTDPGNAVYLEDWYDELMEAVQAYRYGDLALSEETLDTVYLSSDGTADMLVVTDADGIHVYGPSVRSAITVNEYGYQYEDGWILVEDWDSGQYETLTVTLWLVNGLPVADEYQQAVFALRGWQANRGLVLAGTIACGVLGLLLTVGLCVACGHKKEREGIYLNWFHRIPGDLLAAAMLLAGFLVLNAFVEGLLYRVSYSYAYMPMYAQLIMAGCFAAALAALGMGALITFVARCKARTVWRNTVIWRLCRLARRVCLAIPLMWKAALVGAGYLLLTLYVMLCARWNYFESYVQWFFLWFLVTVGLIAYLCLWACQWKRVRRGTKEIVGGNPDYLIDTARMLPDLKRHADELNNLGQAITAAVDDRMRSERFKAELITNVSHDLKTPLTSIINYVDLLKKECIDDPRAAEYIEVLDRKSQRLKKLTEDLVEASKASTGNLAVTRERIGLTQLAEQALAEYAQRLESKRLTVMRTFPEEEVWVEADGRHLWRVLDNLLSNCAKYALEGTRVYVEARKTPDAAVLSMKNISRDELNVPPEMLIERFIRGDESRATEGSGLGLSIAQSLTELQNGRFEIDIDGDLFKASVTLPLAAGTGQSQELGWKEILRPNE